MPAGHHTGRDIAGTLLGYQRDTIRTSSGHCWDIIGTLLGHHQDTTGTLDFPQEHHRGYHRDTNGTPPGHCQDTTGHHLDIGILEIWPNLLRLVLARCYGVRK